MASESSRARNIKISLLPTIGHDEAIQALNLEPASTLAVLLWRRSESDESLRRQIVLKVLDAKLGASTSEADVNLFLLQLAELCRFEAEWRDRESGWAQFLEDVCTAVERIHNWVPFSVKDRRIEAIISSAEESSQQIDDCYQCCIEIERLSNIFNGHAGMRTQEL